MQRTILSRPDIGLCASVIQRSSLELVRVEVAYPTLIWVRHGIKTLRWHGQECVIRSGEMVAIAGGQTFDITNYLPDNQDYQATWLAWDAALIEAFTPTSGQACQVIEDVWPLRRRSPAFISTLEAALAALADQEIPPAVAKHRLNEVLLWLAQEGACFKPRKPDSVSWRVRRLISAAPADKWSAPQIARELAMSEATLRRRLHDETASLGDILVDVRMSMALTLLQATDFPISQIALDAGYESASRFAIRFRQRFGFAPSAIRGHQRASCA